MTAPLLLDDILQQFKQNRDTVKEKRKSTIVGKKTNDEFSLDDEDN